MKQYPKIPREARNDSSVFVFDKLDGSNVRAEWSRKQGFYKFGRRHGLLDDSNPILRDEAPPLIIAKYGEALDQRFRAQRWQKVTAFFEFYGPNSFAGNHADERHTVTLIDVSVHRRGLLEPSTFLELFGDLDVPRVLHIGQFTEDLRRQVEEGTLEGMTYEGVVAKGAAVSPGRPLMYKVKSRAWLQRLRSECRNDTEFERRR